MAGDCKKCGDCSKCPKTKVNEPIDISEDAVVIQEQVLIRIHQVEITMNTTCRSDNNGCQPESSF